MALMSSASESLKEYAADVLGVDISTVRAESSGPSAATGAGAGKAWSSNVHDPGTVFSSKERAVADRLVREGWSVRARPPDHTVEGKKNPDAVVRRSPDDPGTLTEFKTPQSARDTSVQRAIREAGKQLHPYGGGDVIVDCRPMEISVDDARRGYVRAVGEARQRGAPLPDRVVVILPDDSLVTWERTS